MRHIILMLTAQTMLLLGCASNKPVTLGELEDGEIFVQLKGSSDDYDYYAVTYVVDVPFETSWAAADEVSDWLSTAANIEQVIAGPKTKGPDGEIEQRIEVHWKDGRHQQMTLRRIYGKGQSILTVEPLDGPAGVPTRFIIQMDPYRRTNVLVEVEIRLAKSFSPQLDNAVLVPLGLVQQKLHDFWAHLAAKHRETCLTVLKRSTPTTGRTHIVAVGVKPDPSSVWNDILYAEDDAAAFFEWAERTCPADPDDRLLVRELIRGAAATDARLSKVLSKLRNWDDTYVRDGDTIIFFFAGHIDREADFLRDPSTVHNYLLTANAEPANLRATAIRKTDVEDALRFSDASRTMLVLDACYSGGMRFRWSDLVDAPHIETRGPVALNPGFRNVSPAADSKLSILAAADEHQRAIERSDLGHGVFTHAMLKGLEGEADVNRDGYVSLNELDRYVTEQVRDLTDHKQTPYFLYERSADLGWPVAR